MTEHTHTHLGETPIQIHPVAGSGGGMVPREEGMNRRGGLGWIHSFFLLLSFRV